MQLLIRGFFWIALYLVVSVAPLFFAFVGETPPSRSFWTELSVALGFVGLSMLGLQFAVTSRADRVDAPFGLDIVLRFHREISFVAFAFVLAHPVILFIQRPAMLELLNPVTAPWRARFGLISVVGLLAIVVTSVWRTRLRLRYEAWRLLHGVLALVIVLTALLHVEAVGYYVSGAWRRALWAAMSLALVSLLIWVRIIKPWRLLTRPWILEEVAPQRGDSWSIRLRPEGHDGFVFLPGQYAWIFVRRTPYSIREHPFSFSSSAEDHDRIEFTIKESGDFTSRIGELEPGTRLYVDGPYGVFSCERHQAAGFVFIAGGIGITPMMSMLRTLADMSDPRRIILIYGNSAWDDVTFREELRDLEEHLDLEVVHVLESPPEGWDGPTGYIDRDLIAAHLPARPHRFAFFVCGPGPMMDAVEEALHDLGVAEDRIHSERFELI